MCVRRCVAYVWVCGCVRVCECVRIGAGVWVCGCAGVWVCGCESVRVCVDARPVLVI